MPPLSQMPSTDADAPQRFDLPLRVGDGMGLSTERNTSIENALQNYRNRVLEINIAALETAILDLETHEFNATIGPEELFTRRMEQLKDIYGVRLEHPPDPSITSIRDFLSEDRRGNLVRSCWLDGIVHGEGSLTFSRGRRGSKRPSNRSEQRRGRRSIPTVYRLI